MRLPSILDHVWRGVEVHSSQQGRRNCQQLADQENLI